MDAQDYNIYLSVDNIRDISKLPLLGVYNAATHGKACKLARQQFPHLKEYAVICSPVKNKKLS